MSHYILDNFFVIFGKIETFFFKSWSLDSMFISWSWGKATICWFEDRTFFPKIPKKWAKTALNFHWKLNRYVLTLRLLGKMVIITPLQILPNFKRLMEMWFIPMAFHISIFLIWILFAMMEQLLMGTLVQLARKLKKHRVEQSAITMLRSKSLMVKNTHKVLLKK